jgi:phage head maturation protease
MSDQTPPRENLIRAVMPASTTVDDGPKATPARRLSTHPLSPVNEWTEIRSAWEGNFMERFVPGAWKKTHRESGNKIRALFQHGQDPQVGDKPLASDQRLEEDDRGRLRRGGAARHLLQP